MDFEENWKRALLDAALPAPAGLRSWNGSDPAQRFAVYRNNVMLSLTGALADSFPVTRALVGEAFFRAMAREFVSANPPDCAVLAEYGRQFPSFVAAFPETHPLPYLSHLARLEFAYVQTYHAADAGAVSPQQLQALLADADRLAACHLALHPSLHTQRSPYAIVSLWAAHQGQGDIRTVDPIQPESAWVARNGLRVAVFRMCPGDCVFAEALRDGLPLQEAASRAGDADAGFDPAQCLAVMLRENLIAGVI